MDNECLYLCSMASVLSMGALNYTVYLLPLLRPFRFDTNARNKCVTLDFVVINENDDPRLFSNSSTVPLFISSSIGQGKNIVVHHFVFCVCCIYYELMFFLLRDTCTIQMASSCQSFLVFQCTTPHSFRVFPSSSFLLSFLFPSWCLICLELSFFLNFPRFLFIFLVSFRAPLSAFVLSWYIILYLGWIVPRFLFYLLVCVVCLRL